MLLPLSLLDLDARASAAPTLAWPTRQDAAAGAHVGQTRAKGG